MSARTSPAIKMHPRKSTLDRSRRSPGQEIQRVGLADDIKGDLRELGKVAHVALHRPDGLPVMPCGLAVPLELALG